ncbi:AAA family ATPase [Verrucosispora sp. ts21]|uniref:AAA family ATPase n=1 Tax=Verrucosispora sp. ts21 TaxID=2069341 RepID=UPI001E4AFAC8|nr:AAA family ATPase [Verrucosispora sp. ts21]
MTAQTAPPGLILLAGTSESGKSTAGNHLAQRGAQRIKIRTILLALTSGTEVRHEGVTTREGFDTGEFLSALHDRARTEAADVAVVESFIDAQLAHATKESWPGPAAIVFITAAEPLRVNRLAAAINIDHTAARALIKAKDARKRVNEQLPRWRQIADHWIDNRHDLAHFTATLDDVYAATCPSITRTEPS